MKVKYLLIILGATATGKTNLSLTLSKYFKADILNVDSRQFYAEMNIGTAKPDKFILDSTPHHFIGSRSIHDAYSAGEWGKESHFFCETYFKSKNILIAVGGSSLYINALCGNLDELPKDENLRKTIETAFENKGITYLQEHLKALDKEAYEKIDIRNPRRLIRAIEIICLTQQPRSAISSPKRPLPFEIIKIGLSIPREDLYLKINRRIDDMLKMGLMEEVKKLYPYKHLRALQTVGYKELFDFFDGKTSYKRAVELIKQNTRRYAKRQITWFKKYPDIHWFTPNSEQKIITLIESCMNSMGNKK